MPSTYPLPSGPLAAARPKIRLLVVGHTYLTMFSQRKYVAMKRADPTLRLRLVTPPEIIHPFMRYRHERHPELQPEETVPIPVWFGGSHMSYVLHPWKLASVLREFSPTHVHIEEDPHSAVGIETVTLTRIFCRRALISFFIWDNLARVPRIPLSWVKRALTHYSFSRSAFVVSGNREGEQLLRTHKGYVGPAAVLPQVGLDFEDYASPPRAEIRARVLATDEPWIGFVGRLVPEKGIGDLFEALASLTSLRWNLLIIGSGSLKAEIERTWQPLFGARLVCLDAVPHADVADYLKCLDIFVLPSRTMDFWKEQFGLTLAQAMMAGVACIGSNSGAIPEVIGASGIVVPERDPAALRAALRRVLTSPELRKELQQAARKSSIERFTNSSVATSYLVLFRSADKKSCTASPECPLSLIE